MQIPGCKPITDKISSKLQRNRNIAFAMAVSLGVLVVPPAQADLNKGLAAYFPFNGNANDESGNGNHGTVYGATLTEDRFGNNDNAYNFDGVKDFIEIPHSENLSFTQPFSLSAWFYPELVSGGENQEIIGKWHPSNAFGLNYRLCITKTWGGAPHRALFAFEGGPEAISSNEVNLGQWNHVVAIYDGSGVKVYLNGMFEIEKMTTSTPITNTGKVRIGKIPHWDENYFDGMIDDIRIYNRALSESEIQQLYNFGVACIQVITWGKNPETGEWVQFPTPCDVPEGWETSNTDPGYETGYQAGLSACTTQEGPHAVFSATDGKLHIPYIDVPDIFGGMTTYKADMILIPDAELILFSVTGATPVQ